MLLVALHIWSSIVSSFSMSGSFDCLGSSPTIMMACPCVMLFEFDSNSKIFLSLGLDGTPLVSFRKGSRWSGWHGRWEHSEGHFTVTFHFSGHNARAWQHHIFHMAGDLMVMQELGQTKLLRRSMATLVMTQRQLGDTNCAPANADWELV